MSQRLKCTLWMGDIEPYMHEKFLYTAFERALGLPVLKIEVVRDTQTKTPLGYAYVQFPDSDSAQHAMVSLNGRSIFGTMPVKHYMLNTIVAENHTASLDDLKDGKFPLFVWDITSYVDEATLFMSFATRYPNCTGAKLCTDALGQPKGYGFVYFSSERDQSKALIEMQHMTGIGRKPIRVSFIGRRDPVPFPNFSQTQYYSHIYPQYLKYQNAEYEGQLKKYNEDYLQYMKHCSGELNEVGWERYYSQPFEELPVDPDEGQVNVDEENKSFFHISEELYRALDTSRWFPMNSVNVKLKDI